MSFDNRFESLPTEMIDELEESLISPLCEAYKSLGPGQAFVQFIGHSSIASERVPFLTPKKLWLYEKDKRFTLATFPPDSLDGSPMGLTRWAALNNKTVIYPTDPEAENYVDVHAGVQTEIVGPVYFNGKVTGVVLFDSTEKGRHYGAHERELFKSFQQTIDSEILRLGRRKKESFVADELKGIASDCYSETLSARGYIAIKRWDGTLEYFPVGDESKKFLELSPHEGLCGKCFRTGQLQNPQKSLFDDGNYIPSDSDIKSEIVCPIHLHGETIGVINLESYLASAYGEKVESFLIAEAEKAVGAATYYSKPPPEIGSTITDFFRSSLWVRPPPSRAELDEEILSTLGRWAVNLLHGQHYEYWLSSAYWLSSSDEAPNLLRAMSWEKAVQGGSVRQSQQATTVLYAPLLVSGDPTGVIALECDREEVPEELRTLRALCRIASEAFRRARYEYRVRDFIELLETLISESCGEKELIQAVKGIPFLLQSNHCTLFYRLQYDEENVLFTPGPTTAQEVYVRGENPGYLPSVYDGLTGYVAATGSPLRIHDVRDSEELNTRPEVVTWKSIVSEDMKFECRSYLAYPIFDPQNRSMVIGVLRTHRDAKSHRSGFTLEDEGMFKVIAHLLGRPLSIFLTNKG